MIPPVNMLPEDSESKEDDREQDESPKSPSTTASQQETKLQRLKRSLSFKTKSIRSKSADNFFRTSTDTKTELLSDVSSSTGHLCNIGMAPPAIPSAPPAIPSAPPPTSRPQARNPLHDSAGHCFMEHIFKKPTFCDVCNHMIVGTTAKHVVFLAGNTAKHGLRCKACKMSLHHKCENGVGQQRCMGKLPKGFRRYYSSPLLIQGQYGCIKEVMPIACGNKVDPVYEALRFGTSLAQKSKRPSGSESPHRNSLSDLDKVPEEAVAHSSKQELSRKHSDDVFTMENGMEHLHSPERRSDSSLLEPSHLHPVMLKVDTYVALYSYMAQESHDLDVRTWSVCSRARSTMSLNQTSDGLHFHSILNELSLKSREKWLERIRLTDKAGDRILLADDSNDDWWKGVIEDRLGYFPAALAHQVHAGDQVFRCNRTFIGCREQGQITLKEGQICVSSELEHSGFLRVACGKKRGYVPCDVLELV